MRVTAATQALAVSFHSPKEARVAARHLPRSGTRKEGSQVRGTGQTACQKAVNYGRRGTGRPRSSASAPRAADLKPRALRSPAAPLFWPSPLETP